MESERKGSKKMGRPTKYKPEYCQMLIDHMAEGLSFDAFAGKLGLERKTLYNWAKRYPEFKEAKQIGWDKNLFFWEKVGIDGILGRIKNFNAVAYIFNKKCRFPEWRERNSEEGQARITTVQIQLPERNIKKVISNDPATIEVSKGK